MTQVNAAVKNLLVIDSQVSNWQSLAAGIGTDTDTAVLILDSGSDGLKQISDYLTNLAASKQDFVPLQSLQIISHGSAGSLLLGSSTLTTGSLKQYTSQLAGIGSSLTATGDILLYGCNVAAGQSGLDFINLFSTLTNADVAASTDVTGSAALGGDWQLEASTGSIEATGVLSANIQTNYAGSLAIPVVTITAGITPVEGAAGSFIVTLDSPAPAGGLTINYNLSGTATLNTDYTVTAGTHITAVKNGSFTITQGQTTASLTINAASLDGYDPNETVGISLHTGSGYSFVSATTFAPKVDLATDSHVESDSVVGDFNGDGKLDLAVTNLASNTGSVSVLLRNSDNTGFEPKVDFTTGSYPRSVSVGDFNGDGKIDLVVANSWSGTVSVLLRNAANTSFDPKLDFATGSYPTSVSVCDFNGDGKTDLVVANVSSDTVSVLLRNADNTDFNPTVDLATGSMPESVRVGDFNGDGKADLVVANYGSNSVSVLLRNAANTGFYPKVDVATGSHPPSVSIGDFNGDGKTDLAVANSGSNTVSVLLRNAANTGFDPKMDFTTGSRPSSVSVGDFNGDGKTDLVVANFWSNTVSVLLRNAANTDFYPKVDFATGSYRPTSVSVGDFNGDGKTDLAVANYYSNTVSVLLNNTTPNASVIITDTHINTPPKLPAVTPSLINGTLTSSDALNPFSAGNYYKAYTPIGFIDARPLTIALDSKAFDTYLQVIRNGSVLTFNDDSNGSFNSIIDYTYQTGDKIYVTSSGGLDTGTYSLNLTGTSIPAFEVLTTQEDALATLTTTMLPITDLEQTAAQLTYTLATLPLKGLLSKADINLIAGNTFTQADVNNGLIKLSPKANANGTDSFTFSVADGKGGVLAKQTFAINITPINDAPTLTAFAAPVASGNEDNPIPVTFASLKAQGNEVDVDGTVVAFVIKAVNTGKLLIGASAGTATAWNASNNNIIDLTHQAFWTPATNANGSLNAFTAVAKDNGGLLSATPIQAKINVAPVRDDRIINGSLGNDSLTGDTIDSGSYDTLNGLAGNDILKGLLGNDTLNGGAGADIMKGGDGSDTYFVDNVGDVVIETNALASAGGTDLVNSYLAAYTLGANVENGRILASGAANLSGNSLNNVIYAGNGINSLDGLGGTDTLSYQYATTTSNVGVTLNLSALNASGQAKASGISGADLIKNIENITGSNYNDTLTGNAAANTLNGGAGNDLLTGGNGTDKLTGGAGADTFDFNALLESIKGNTRDSITDFTHSQADKIDLAGIDANSKVAGDQGFTYIGAKTFTGIAGQLDYLNGILAGDTNGDKVADFEIAITLVGGTALVSADFVL
ncbi:MAG: FG-GAP-like repeat-containing protein [Methylococcaceae bacterium]